MSTPIRRLPNLKPVTFPGSKPGASASYRAKASKGKSTSTVIAEMKRLSKKDIYPPTSNAQK